jgi:hypothetical protein
LKPGVGSNANIRLKPVAINAWKQTQADIGQTMT